MGGWWGGLVVRCSWLVVGSQRSVARGKSADSSFPGGRALVTIILLAGRRVAIALAREKGARIVPIPTLLSLKRRRSLETRCPCETSQLGRALDS